MMSQGVSLDFPMNNACISNDDFHKGRGCYIYEENTLVLIQFRTIQPWQKSALYFYILQTVTNHEPLEVTNIHHVNLQV